MVVRHIDSYVCVSQQRQPMSRERLRPRPPSSSTPVSTPTLFRPARRSEVPTLVYAGSLTEERKGLPLLASAVRLLRESVPALRFEVYGQGTPPPEVAAVADVCAVLDSARARRAVRRRLGDRAAQQRRSRSAWC